MRMPMLPEDDLGVEDGTVRVARSGRLASSRGSPRPAVKDASSWWPPSTEVTLVIGTGEPTPSAGEDGLRAALALLMDAGLGAGRAAEVATTAPSASSVAVAAPQRTVKR